MTADDPRSAPELKKIILELCAAYRPAGIPRLMLVAQGVKEWYFQLGVIHNAYHSPSELSGSKPPCTVSSALASRPR
jgi:hypothetical protein